MKKVLCLLALLLVVLGTQAQLEGVIHEEVASGPIGTIPAGYSTYKIYALMTSMNYRVSSVYGVATAGYEHRLQIGSCSSNAQVWNSSLGGATGDDMSCANFNTGGDAPYDSYLTIQQGSACTSPGVTVSNTPSASADLSAAFATAPFGNTLNTFNLAMGSSSPPFAIGVGSDFRILIAQVTVPTGTLVYALNINVFLGGQVSSPIRYVHTLDGAVNPTTEVDGTSLGLVYGLDNCTLCNDPQSCNYNASATVSTFCEAISCAGCTQLGAVNYNPSATLDNGTCYNDVPNLVINEVLYGIAAYYALPAGKPNGFIEIYNAENYAVDISNYRTMHGIGYAFPQGTIMQPHEHIVLATSANSALTPSYQIFFGAANDNLSSLDSIKLYNNANVLVDEVSWGWQSPWPTTTWVVGATLNLENPGLNNTDPANWCYSAEIYGSPGESNTCRINGCNNQVACNYQMAANFNDGTCIFCVCGYECGCMDPVALNYNPQALWTGEPCLYPAYDIVINEIKGGNTITNYVELYNADNQTIDISGYRLADPTCCNYGFTYTFPQGISMAPGEYLLVHGTSTQYNSLGVQQFSWTGTGSMLNGLSDLKLYEQHGMLIDSVKTSDAFNNNWDYATTQARELINPTANNAMGVNWCVWNAGTPGVVNHCYNAVITGCQDPTAYNYEPAATVDGTCDYPDGGLTCAQAAVAMCGQMYEGTTVSGMSANDNGTAGFTYCGFDSNYRQNWFKYTATQNGMTHIDLCFPETAVAFKIQVFIGTCGELYCYESSNNGTCAASGAADLDFYVVAGEQYYIRISSPSSNTNGAFRMMLTCTAMSAECNDVNACNYDPQASNSLTCEYASCLGCTDSNALNYEATATIDNGSCYTQVPLIVINEVNKSYNSSGGYSTSAQFMELYNTTNHDIDLTGWTINNGTMITFPAAAYIKAFDYILIGNMPPLSYEDVTDAYDDVFPFPTNYDIRDNTYLVLKDANDNVIDSISIGTGFPWTASSAYNSTELKNPFLDNNYAPNWAITLNPNQYQANTPLLQNTMFDPLGFTCQDSMACNYNPFIESSDAHCDYTCFWTDPVIDNDASNSPLVLYDGSTLHLTRPQMSSGVSAAVASCNPTFHDVWFTLNTMQYDTVHVDLTAVTSPTLGVTVYRLNGASLQQVYCSTFNGAWTLAIETLSGFDHEQTYYFSLYMLTSTCTNCASAYVDLHANFFSRSCTDPLACNFNPAASVDDGSCEYSSCYGCSDENACNFNPMYTFDDGSCCFNRCVHVVMTGGDHPEELQWQLMAVDSTIIESGFVADTLLCLVDSCYTVTLADTALNGWGGATWSLMDEVGYVIQDSTVTDSLDHEFQLCLNVIPPVMGCMDSAACNYNSDAEEDDGSCLSACPGCTIDWAMNYNPGATYNDGSCLFPPAQGTSCGTPIQLFCGATPFVFQTMDVPNDNFDAGLSGLTCITNNMGSGQLWFIYTTEVSQHVYVTLNQAVNTCLGFSSTVNVFHGTCGDFECMPYDYTSPYSFYALAGETYYIRAHIEDDSFGCGYSGSIAVTTCYEVVAGCIDNAACNYDSQADIDNGNCDYTCLYGCTNQLACNYDPTTIYDDGSCYFNCVYGCVDSLACNFNPEANTDDGSCVILATCIPGCTASDACNYDPQATYDDASCEYTCLIGCMEIGACNYNYQAIYNDFSCDYTCFASGCTDPLACNFNGYSVVDNGSCLNDSCVFGCTQPNACNYNPEANAEDFTCVYGCTPGCMVVSACNFNAAANYEDGSCLMAGCMIESAINYNATASCSAPCYFDCIADLDGSGSMDMADFLMILGAFGCVQDCGANDLNGDGIVGASDLQIFLTFYGVLCVE